MQERSLLDYWLIIYERRVVVYLVIVTSIISAFLIGELVTPIYEARSVLYIPAKLAPVSYVAGGSTATLAREPGSPLAKEADYKPYMGMLKSVQIAQIVNAKYPMKSVTKLLRSDVDFEVTDELVVRIYSRDPDPKLAADVANAYVEALNKILTDSSQAQVYREPDYIKSALSRINEELQKAQSELSLFEEKHHLANLDAELAALSAKKSALQDKADETLVQIAASLGKKTALVQEFKREGQDLESSEVAMTSPLIQNLRTQLTEALTKLSELEVELGSKNLQVMAQRQRKQELEQKLSEEIKRWFSSRVKPESSYLENLRQQLVDVVIEEQRLQAMNQANVQSIVRLNKRVSAYPEIKARAAVLNANLERHRKLQEQLQVNLTEAQLQTDRQMHLVVQLDRAEPPRRPAFPIWWLNVLVALIAGTLAGVGYAFFLNYLEETRNIRTLRLVRAILGQRRAEAV
jgi:succinoglycan biosynthesis transport protein ExoP